VTRGAIGRRKSVEEPDTTTGGSSRRAIEALPIAGGACDGAARPTLAWVGASDARAGKIATPSASPIATKSEVLSPRTARKLCTT
jgi:hypothetical protein